MRRIPSTSPQKLRFAWLLVVAACLALASISQAAAPRKAGPFPSWRAFVLPYGDSTATAFFVLNDLGQPTLVVVNSGTQTELLRWTLVPEDQPAPPPIPPGPLPPPAPGKLSVLAVYETQDLTKIPAAQAAVITSLPIKEYLASHCAKDQAGNPEWRFFDKDADVSKQPQAVQELFKRAAGKTPWLVIGNGDTVVFEGEWPATSAAFLALLKQYGGP